MTMIATNIKVPWVPITQNFKESCPERKTNMLRQIFLNPFSKVMGWTIIFTASDYFLGILSCKLFPQYFEGKPDTLTLLGIGFIAWCIIGTFLFCGWFIYMIVEMRD